MREIKFRVWDNEENKFVKPCLESEEDRYNKGMAMIHWNSKGKLWFTLSGYRDKDGNPYQIDSKIMQYTGLNDKNGKEIYEGDILECVLGWKYVVEWDEEEGRFLGYTLENERKIAYVGREPKSKIIGNIYENPELLNGGHENE